jgi:hypothetical protein
MWRAGFGCTDGMDLIIKSRIGQEFLVGLDSVPVH